MIIGKVTSATSQVAYICQVYGPGESARMPRPEDYAFGVFVAIERAQGGRLVAIISNTSLLNPEFGYLGPRLSPESELAVFSPDYLAEKRTLVALTALGQVDARGAVSQGVPALAAQVDDAVRCLETAEIVAFHAGAQGLQATYLPWLVGPTAGPLAAPLALEILRRLEELFPHEARRLALVRNSVAWKARVQPLG